jgi:hypothetical protein
MMVCAGGDGDMHTRDAVTVMATDVFVAVGAAACSEVESCNTAACNLMAWSVVVTEKAVAVRGSGGSSVRWGCIVVCDLFGVVGDTTGAVLQPKRRDAESFVRSDVADEARRVHAASVRTLLRRAVAVKQHPVQSAAHSLWRWRWAATA